MNPDSRGLNNAGAGAYRGSHKPEATDALISAAISFLLLCTLKFTIVIEFSAWTVLLFVLFWHLLFFVLSWVRLSSKTIVKIVVIFIGAVALFTVFGGMKPVVDWMGEFFGWIAWSTEHNAPRFATYRTIVAAAVSFLFSAAMFMLTRYRANVGMVLLVGVFVFMGMQFTGFVYPEWNLWGFLFCILLVATKQTDWHSGKRYKFLLSMAPSCAVLLLLAFLFMPSDLSMRGQWLVDTAARLFGDETLTSDIGLFSVTKVAVGSFGGVESELGGAFDPSDITMLYLSADEPLYLKGLSSSEYTGRSWRQAPQNSAEFSDEWFSGGEYPFYDIMARYRMTFGGEAASETDRITAERYQLPLMLNDLQGREAQGILAREPGYEWYALGSATVHYWDIATRSVFIPSGFASFYRPQEAEEGWEEPFNIDWTQTVTADETQRKEDTYDFHYFKYNLSPEEWDALLDLSNSFYPIYQMSRPPAFDSETASRFWETYLQLPDTLPQRVYDLTEELTAGAETMRQKAEAIEQYLSSQFPYSTEMPETPPGRDFVDYFLFDARRGYCTYYATAMTVMCRMAGIPARYVEGFVFNPEKYQGFYYAKASQAHAWVEVYYGGIGWIPYEPTAGFGQAFREVYRGEEPESTFTPIIGDEGLTEDPTPPPTRPPTDVSSGDDAPNTRETIWEYGTVWVAIALIAAFVWIAYNGVRRNRFRSWLAWTAYGIRGVARIYKRYLLMLRLLHFTPVRTETPQEFAVRCGGALNDNGALLCIAEIRGRAVYGGLPPTEKQRLAAVKAIEFLELQLRATKRGKMLMLLQRYVLGRL
ncbi:MAG: transglutaminase-like domain-containing protein [Oscillospiraceae bacterium]|jgi:transglutaminase-like putative cysteine protease|nr:transglutaminase-like domain-containing protein [Oscillospiraceae bacterium]